VGFSSEPAYRKDFGPFTPGFKTVPFGSADALERAITPETCAFIVEPIQGEAGIILPPKGWLKEVERICKQHRVLLILDEVQSGLGRTGKLFAFQHEEIHPDGLILGKALGGGLLPVSAFLSSKEVMELFEPGSHGSTFGGNPLAAAVGLEALHVLREEKLVEKSAELGAYLLKRLQALKSPLIKEVRGRGLWVGVEVYPEKVSARAICEQLMERGVLAKETHQVVIRIAPPLVIAREDLDWALEQFEAVLQGFNS
jgi:ornithine--oxo-acid transaminase